MANLPPRPESPFRMRDERRHTTDDRDRDRRSAQPMAPRFRGERERIPERDRAYIPRPRSDTYIASGSDSRREYEGRRGDYDSNDRDRERDRHRDFDRDRRSWGGRERERDSSPRRWEPPADRDRRSYDHDRGPNRRSSPVRRSAISHRSRSPPRRRGPSPPYRGRNRSRSRSPRPPSPTKRIRLGNHSIAASPRAQSPAYRRRSQDRSHSPAPRARIVASTSTPSKEQSVPRNKSRATTPVDAEVEKPVLAPTQPSASVEVVEQQVGSPDIKSISPPDPPISYQTHSPKIPSPVEKMDEEQTTLILPVPQNLPASPGDQKKLDFPESKVDRRSPLPPQNVARNQTRRSPSPPRYPRHDNAGRGPPTGPQRGWAPRSPPRGPRGHPKSMAMSQGSTASYPTAPRGPRRGHPPTGPSSSYSSPAVTVQKQFPDADVKISLPQIPKYNKSQEMVDLDRELTRLQSHRPHVAAEHLQRAKGLRRALHELDMATIDLRAAETRRQIADMQLEKAKSGSLGIDALSIVMST
ncbi:hypothetical protein B0H34DRAFT_309465 [Crassisporium funariophilum]|nr:hypothetical protein B0H34DRAFT_309465 [Crassisporium funariophilum]